MGKELLTAPTTRNGVGREQYRSQRVAFDYFVETLSKELGGKYTNAQLIEAERYFNEVAAAERKKQNLPEGAVTNASAIAKSISTFRLYHEKLVPQEQPNGNVYVDDSAYTAFQGAYNSGLINALKVGDKELSLKDALYQFCQDHGFHTMGRNACKLVNDLAQTFENFERRTELIVKTFDTKYQQEVVDYCKDVSDLQNDEKQLSENAAKNNVDLTRIDELTELSAQAAERAEKERREFARQEVEYYSKWADNDKLYKKAKQEYEEVHGKYTAFQNRMTQLEEGLFGNLVRYCNEYNKQEERRLKVLNANERIRKELDEDERLPLTISRLENNISQLKKLESATRSDKAYKNYLKEVKPLNEKLSLAQTLFEEISSIEEWTDADAKSKFNSLSKHVSTYLKGTESAKIFEQSLGIKLKEMLGDKNLSTAGAYKRAMNSVYLRMNLLETVNKIAQEKHKDIATIEAKPEYAKIIRQEYDLQKNIEVSEKQLKDFKARPRLTEEIRKAKENEIVANEEMAKMIPTQQQMLYDKLCEGYGLPKQEKLPFRGTFLDFGQGARELMPLFKEGLNKLKANPPVSMAEVQEKEKQYRELAEIDEKYSTKTFSGKMSQLKDVEIKAKLSHEKLASMQKQLHACAKRNNELSQRETDLRSRNELKSNQLNKESVYESIKWFKDHANDAIKSADYSNSKAYKAMMGSVDAALAAISDDKVSKADKVKAVKDMKDATKAYIDKKGTQTRLKPSVQRRTRLSYANSLLKLAESTYKDMTELAPSLPANEVVSQFVDKRSFCSEKSPEEYSSRLADNVKSIQQAEKIKELQTNDKVLGEKPKEMEKSYATEKNTFI